MSRLFVLQVDYPGYAAGSNLTQGSNGRYYSDDGMFWLEPTIVEGDDGTHFLEPAAVWAPQPGVDSYFYVDATGVVQQASYAASDGDQALLAAGNFFQTADAATQFSAKFATILTPSPLQAAILTQTTTAISKTKLGGPATPAPTAPGVS